MPGVIFWIGVGFTVLTGGMSWLKAGDDKRGVVALPFAILLAAAVAHYIGIA